MANPEKVILSLEKEGLEEVPDLPETATITEPRPDAEVRGVIAAVVARADPDLAEDLLIALQVEERLRTDTGERLTLVELIEGQDFDPRDFGVE